MTAFALSEFTILKIHQGPKDFVIRPSSWDNS